MEKLLSVIVPSYNMEKYLDKCIGSCIVQDVGLNQLLDIIVVNDGSKDKTSEIAHAWEKKYPGIVRVIDKPNGNYGSCINAAIPIAQGRFVKILDADDSFDNKNFEGFLRFLKSQPSDIDVAIFDYVSVDPDEQIVNSLVYDLPTDRVFMVDELATLTPKIVWMNVVAYHRSLFEKTKYVQTEGISYTDMEWNFIPMAVAHKCVYLKYPVHRYLVGRLGQTTNAETQSKNIWMNGKVALSLMNWGEKLKIDYTSERGKYLERIIIDLLRLIYGMCLFGKSPKNKEWLNEFDRDVKSLHPYFYDVPDAWYVSNRVKFHYVRAWRCRESLLSKIKLSLFSIYQKATAIWKK